MNQKNLVVILGVAVVILLGTTVYFATISNTNQPKKAPVAKQPMTPVQQPAANQSVATQPTPTTPASNSDLAYKNEKYGFELTFPITWRGYKATNRMLEWGENGTSDSIDFGFAAQDSIFNVSVFSKSQWKKITSETGMFPTYLGENNQYVFAYDQAQDAATDEILKRMMEVESIVKTFKITK